MGKLWDGKNYTITSNLLKQGKNELIEQLSFSEDALVLDVGCGVGDLMFKIAKMIPKGHVTGMDGSSSMIEQCLQKLKENKLPNVDCIQKNVLETDFKNQFDIVYSNSVFQWIKEPDKAINLLYNSLKPNGSLGIQFPLLNAQHPFVVVCEKTITNLGLKDKFRNWHPPWYIPSLEEIKELLRPYDFQQIKAYTKLVEHDFHHSTHVFKTFDIAGLSLYTAQLSPQEAEEFNAEVFHEIEKLQQGDKLILHIERLFAFGFNKNTK